MPNPANITVAILAGGLGTRLRSVVADRPKAMAPVLGRPFLAWWLDALERAGFQKVVLCTGFLAAQIQEHFGPRYRSLSLAYSVEETPLGTGGALRQALGQMDSELILALNGDSFCDADFAGLIHQHTLFQPAATMALSHVEDTRRFGRVSQHRDGRVSAFLEKSSAGGPGWINAGIYLFSRDLLAPISAGRPVSLEREVLPGWMRQGLLGVRMIGEFIDIGTPESFAQAAEFFSARAAA